MAEQNNIDLEQKDFDELHARAKAVDNGWAEQIVSRLNPNIENSDRFRKYYPLNTKKIYNTFSGVVTNAAWRVYVFSEVSLWITEQIAAASRVKANGPGYDANNSDSIQHIAG